MDEARVLRVYLLSIGSEVLRGELVDTNAAELARELTLRGAQVVGHRAVADQLEEVEAAFRDALARARWVVATGGLGPTLDDLTREGLARAVGRKLRTDPQAAQALRDRYLREGRPMPQETLRQAQVVEGADLLPNEEGTAPGMRLALADGRQVFLLPGPPREMRAMAERELYPQAEREAGKAVVVRTLRVTGVGESLVDEILADLMGDTNPVLRPYAQEVEVRLTLVSSHPDPDKAKEKAQAVVAEVARRLGPALYSLDGRSLEETVVEALEERHLTLATAESLTAGLVSARLAQVPGASRVLVGGAVVYHERVKEDLLGVPLALQGQAGVVSREVAAAMAQGARERLGADYAVALTGWAGPDHPPQEPAGLVYVAVADAHGVRVARRQFTGPRNHVRLLASQTALDLVRRTVLGLPFPVTGDPREALGSAPEVAR
jgi:nicotinamide-nucleotide amidase